MKKILFLLLTLSHFSIAEKCKETENFYYDRNRGWYYGEVCDDNEDEEEKKEAHKEQAEKSKEQKKYKKLRPEDKIVKIPWDVIDSLPREELIKIEEEAEYLSTINPTEENVKQVLLLKAKLMNMVERKTQIAKKIKKTDADFIKESKIPVSSSWERNILDSIEERKRKKTLKDYRYKAEIVVFAKRDCPYCREEKKIIKEFEEKWKWNTRFIYIEDNKEIAKKLKVFKVPDIFIFLKTDEGTNFFQRVATGIQTLSSLENSIFYGINLIKETQNEVNNEKNDN